MRCAVTKRGNSGGERQGIYDDRQQASERILDVSSAAEWELTERVLILELGHDGMGEGEAMGGSVERVADVCATMRTNNEQSVLIEPLLSEM